MCFFYFLCSVLHLKEAVAQLEQVGHYSEVGGLTRGFSCPHVKGVLETPIPKKLFPKYKLLWLKAFTKSMYSATNNENYYIER